MIKKFESYHQNDIGEIKNLFNDCFVDLEDKYNLEIIHPEGDDQFEEDSILFLLDMGEIEMDRSIVEFEARQAKSNLKMLLDIIENVIKFNKLSPNGELYIKEILDEDIEEHQMDLHLLYEGNCAILLQYDFK